MRIRDIHLEYFLAGADIVETNTFSSTSIVLADYGMEALAYELNVEGARLARRGRDACARPRTAAGGSSPARSGRPTRPRRCRPTSAAPASAASPSTQLVAAYGEAINGLIDGGADLLLFETITDTLNTKAGLFAAEKIFNERGITRPIMISGTITDLSGRTLSGQTPTAFWYSVRHATPFTIGLNCALGAATMRAHIAELSDVADTFVCAYPNAGLPNSFGGYDETPEFMAAAARGLCQRRAGQHRRRLLRLDAGPYPRHRRRRSASTSRAQIPEIAPKMRLSGLEPFTLTDEIPFVNIGERTNVTGSARFRKLITAGDFPGGARGCARPGRRTARRSSTSTWTRA